MRRARSLRAKVSIRKPDRAELCGPCTRVGRDFWGLCERRAGSVGMSPCRQPALDEGDERLLDQSIFKRMKRKEGDSGVRTEPSGSGR